MTQSSKEDFHTHSGQSTADPSSVDVGVLRPTFAEAGAILTIDLGAIRENYRRLRAMLGSVKCAGVVKADAYGLGAARVAPALAAEGCDTFFVAHIAEGVALRQILGAKPEIFILNGLPPGAEPACAAHALFPVLNSADQLAAWRGEASKARRKLPAALQVDSGMARIGMSPAEVERIADEPRAFDGIDLRLVMSHLARADEPHEAANASQQAAFERLAARLPHAQRAFANSSGIFLGSSYHFDLARPGVALYGINPLPGQPNPMAPVVGLQAKVIQTRTVGLNDGIGYGHAAQATGIFQLATISLGYADGWHRRTASSAFHNGVRLPFIGRVSMDSIILDITALPVGELAAGSLVELIGEHQSVDDVAAQAGTIGYEILTSLGNRFHRIYKGG